MAEVLVTKFFDHALDTSLFRDYEQAFFKSLRNRYPNQFNTTKYTPRSCSRKMTEEHSHFTELIDEQYNEDWLGMTAFLDPQEIRFKCPSQKQQSRGRMTGKNEELKIMSPRGSVKSKSSSYRNPQDTETPYEVLSATIKDGQTPVMPDISDVLSDNQIPEPVEDKAEEEQPEEMDKAKKKRKKRKNKSDEKIPEVQFKILQTSEVECHAEVVNLVGIGHDFFVVRTDA